MKFLFLLLIPLLVVSCASDEKDYEKIRDEVSHVKVKSGQELNTSLHELINHSKTLDKDQKKELLVLVDDIRVKNQALQEETLKLRLVLIKELISSKVSQEQVRIIKKDILKSEEKRLKNTFSAIDKIAKIVAKDPESEAFVTHMLAIDRPIR